MASVYILRPDQSHAVYEDFEIPDMLRDGQVTPQTYYWQPGMTEWRPVSELVTTLPPAAAVVLTPSSSGKSSGYFFRRNLEPWATILKILLALCFADAALNFHAALQEMALARQPSDSGAAFNSPRPLLMDLLISDGAGLVTAVFFVVWVFRAHKNCRGFSSGLRFTSGMAAGSYFIPFVNLVYPCLAMLEIWRVSSDPKRWHRRPAAPLVDIWWGLWILCGLAACLLGFHAPLVADALMNHALGMMIYYGLQMLVSVAAFILISVITTRQKRLVRLAR
jgi:hypothetical protein